METQKEQTNIPSATATTGNETIFSDVVDTSPYDKSLKSARIWLYVIAAMQAGMGIYEYATIDDKDVALVAGIIDFGIAVLFVLFAIWSYRKPAIAFMSALITFVVIHVGFGILEPSNIYKGIILKIFVVIALIKAFNDAREVEKLRETTGQS